MALVKNLSNDIKNLEREISRMKKGGQVSARNTTLCANCKKEGFHQPQDCFELIKNKDKRPPVWISALWRCGKESISNLSNSSNELLQHNANFSPTLKSSLHSSHHPQATGIVDSGATDIYFSTDYPIVNVDRSAPKVTVGTATVQYQKSTGTGELNLPKLPYGFPVTGHIMPGFQHTLIVLGPLCDADYTVAFTSAAVIVRDSWNIPVLTGWRKQSGPRLWRIALQTGESDLPKMPHNANSTTLKACSAYDLPSIWVLQS